MSFMNKEQIVKAISSIDNRGKKLDKDIQECAVSILNHCKDNGEVSLVNKLWFAMPKGSRRNALAEWFLAFGAIEVNTDKATMKNHPFKHVKGGDYNIAEAQTKMWYDFKPEKALELEFDLNARLMQLFKQMDKASKDGANIKADDDVLAAITVLRTKLTNV